MNSSSNGIRTNLVYMQVQTSAFDDWRITVAIPFPDKSKSISICSFAFAGDDIARNYMLLTHVIDDVMIWFA